MPIVADPVRTDGRLLVTRGGTRVARFLELERGGRRVADLLEPVPGACRDRTGAAVRVLSSFSVDLDDGALRP